MEKEYKIVDGFLMPTITTTVVKGLDILDELQQRHEKISKKHRWKKPDRKIKPRRYHK